MTQNASLSLDDLREMTGGRLGEHDVACPICGPDRREPRNRTRKVLHIWAVDHDFMTYSCARCDIHGAAHADGQGRRIDPEVMRRARALADARHKVAGAERLQLARWLWRNRLAIPGTVVERYLCEARGCPGPYPATLGYLPARGQHPAAMIAAFGIPLEPEPSMLSMPDDAVRGVQITCLADSGRKIPDDPKLTIGRCIGQPIVLSPLNDALGLAIAEGVEDALSIHAATGLGAWAAGGASRLPSLAGTVPAYTDCVTVVVDDDPAGRRHSAELVARLSDRRFNVETLDVAAPT